MHPYDSAARRTSKRLAVAARVSTVDQERYGTSVEDQARRGALLAELHQMELVDSRAYQGDESGALPLKARPILQRMLADARTRKFDAIVFHKIDRIARRLKYILEIWDAFEEAGVTIYIIEPAIDTSDIMGRLLRKILGTIAEFERDMLLERTDGGKKREMKAGAIYLPRGKYGYQYVPRDRARGIVPGVRPHPEHAEVVRRIFRLGRLKWSQERIADLLTAEGVPTPSQAAGHKRASRRWHPSTVGYIIADPAYMGCGRRGRISVVLDQDGRRKRRVRRDGFEDVAWPPLVDREEWEGANEAREQNHRCTVRAGLDRYLFYGGMVRCAEHGTSMTGSGSARGSRFYRCYQKRPDGGRTTHGCPADALEDTVWAKVNVALLDEDLMIGAAERLAREAEAGMESAVRRKAEIAARLEKLAQDIRWINTTLRASGASAQEIAEQKAEVYAEQQTLHAELEKVDAQLALAQSEIPRAQEVARLCHLFAERATHADAATKRALLEALETTIVLDGNRFRFEGVLSELGLEGEVCVHSTESSW